jgi:hypothetical protein
MLAKINAIGLQGGRRSGIISINVTLTMPFDIENANLRHSSFCIILASGGGKIGQKMQPLDNYVERIA